MKTCLRPLILGFILLILLMPGCRQTSPGAAPLPANTVPVQSLKSELPPVPKEQPAQAGNVNIKLPEPRLKSDVSLEEALYKRRSIRQYSASPLTLIDISQLCWAAQGITDSSGKRTAPSAVAIYPLEIYLAVGNVEGLVAGVYLYSPAGHELVKMKDGDLRAELGNQITINKAAVDIVIAANNDKLTGRFGDTGIKWAYLEAGHVAQNICPQATALNFGTVTVGGFTEGQVKAVLGLTDNKSVLYVLPVGKKT